MALRTRMPWAMSRRKLHGVGPNPTTSVGKHGDRALPIGALMMHRAVMPITMFGHRMSNTIDIDHAKPHPNTP